MTKFPQGSLPSLFSICIKMSHSKLQNNFPEKLHNFEANSEVLFLKGYFRLSNKLLTSFTQPLEIIPLSRIKKRFNMIN